MPLPSDGPEPALLEADLPDDPTRIFEAILAVDRRGDSLPRLYDPLRAVAPVWRAPVERLGRPWIVTRHADAAALVRSSAFIKDERLLGLAGVGAGGAFIDVMRRMFAFPVPLPLTVICRLLGAPVEDVPRIEGWAVTFARRADPAAALTPDREPDREGHARAAATTGRARLATRPSRGDRGRDGGASALRYVGPDQHEIRLVRLRVEW